MIDTPSLLNVKCWLTPNFTVEELIFSDTAPRRGIDNNPTPEILLNLKKIAETLEEVRVLIKGPVFITSGYRSSTLNKAVGGAKKSAHVLGLAADINAPHLTPEELVTLIAGSNIVFDQLILEFDRWCHIGLSIDSHRQQILTARRIDGSVVYLPGIQ
jgi:zinc D-Ala-D-Ala carboxypeptidase